MPPWLHDNSASYFLFRCPAQKRLQIVIHKNLRLTIENPFLAELLKIDEADFGPEIDPPLSARSIICLAADGFIGRMCEKDMKGKVFFSHTLCTPFHSFPLSLPPSLPPSPSLCFYQDCAGGARSISPVPTGGSDPPQDQTCPQEDS